MEMLFIPGPLPDNYTSGKKYHNETRTANYPLDFNHLDKSSFLHNPPILEFIEPLSDNYNHIMSMYYEPFRDFIGTLKFV